MSRYTEEENKAHDERASRLGHDAAVLGLGAIKGIASLTSKSNRWLASKVDGYEDSAGFRITEKVAAMDVPSVRETLTQALVKTAGAHDVEAARGGHGGDTGLAYTESCEYDPDFETRVAETQERRDSADREAYGTERLVKTLGRAIFGRRQR